MFPIETHDNINDFPPIFERRTFKPHQYPQKYDYYQTPQRVNKLIPHLGPVTNYTCTMQELLIIIHLGAKITNVTSILTFSTTPFVRSYLETLRALRQKAIDAGNTPLSTFIKLFMNAIYGKFCQDEFKYLDIKLVTSAEDFEKIVRSVRFVKAKYNKHNCLTTQRKKTNTKRALVGVVAMILGISKANLLYVWYFRLKPSLLKPTIFTPKPSLRICYIGTDCFIIYMQIHLYDYLRVMKGELAHFF